MKDKNVKKWLKFTSIVTYKVPVYEDGMGNPIVNKKFTTEPKEQKNFSKKQKSKAKNKNKDNEKDIGISKEDMGQQKW